MFVRNLKINNMYYITILDFATCTVDQYNLNNHFDYYTLDNLQTDEIESFIVSEGYKLSNIEWMSHSDNTIYKF